MKKIFTLALSFFFIGQIFAQTPTLNFTFVANFPYNEESSDIWGYYHEATGVEYAIVGLNSGTSIISLEDPANPEQIAYYPGTNSTWRDIKTWDHYAYVVNDDGGGLDIIDFSPLPMNPPTKLTWTGPLSIGTLNNCHNIFIDEFGYAYLAGANLNDGGVVILDLNTTPTNPTLAGTAPSNYAHDVYVRDNIMYTSDINDGVFTIYDVSDKVNIVFEAQKATPFNYTHNAWLSDDGNYLYTTDELANAPVGAYDVSDFDDVKEVDQYVPYETLGKGVVPHNVHVWQEWLVISYYTDGCIIVDASRPDNLVEVGNFDSFIPESTGFEGAWGAYPFLPSELVLVSDIGNGLYILEPNYVKACYLEGIVKSDKTNAGLSGATLKLKTTNVAAQSLFSGDLKTGFAVPGVYEAEFSHPAHFSKTINVTLENGIVTPFDVTLESKPTYAFTGTVKDEKTGAPVADAIVNMENEFFGDNQVKTDASGAFSFAAVIEGDYDLVVGRWGYHTQISDQSLFENGSRDIEIKPGIQDNFSLDLGWTIDSDAPQGRWERGAPIEANAPFGPITPGMDFADEDFGNTCYVTGNTSDLFGGVVINGYTTLTSPVFDLSNYGQPELLFASWIFTFNLSTNLGGNSFIEVKITNGMTEVVLDQLAYPSLGSPLNWEGNFYQLKDFIELTDQMQVSFTVDASAAQQVAEAGIDFFEISDLNPPTAINDLFLESATIAVQPNPSDAGFNIDYQLPAAFDNAQVLVYNILGREEARFDLDHAQGRVLFNAPQKGIYLAQIMVDGEVTRSVKLVRN